MRDLNPGLPDPIVDCSHATLLIPLSSDSPCTHGVFTEHIICTVDKAKSKAGGLVSWRRDAGKNSTRIRVGPVVSPLIDLRRRSDRNSFGNFVQGRAFSVTSGRDDRPSCTLSEMGARGVCDCQLQICLGPRGCGRTRGLPKHSRWTANTLSGRGGGSSGPGVRHPVQSVSPTAVRPAGEADHGGGRHPKVCPRGQQPHHLLLW